MLIERWTLGVLEFRVWVSIVDFENVRCFAYSLVLPSFSHYFMHSAKVLLTIKTTIQLDGVKKQDAYTMIYILHKIVVVVWMVECWMPSAERWMYLSRIFNLHFIYLFHVFYINFVGNFPPIFIGWFSLGWAIIKLFWVHSLQLTMSNIILNGGWFCFFFLFCYYFLIFLLFSLCLSLTIHKIYWCDII